MWTCPKCSKKIDDAFEICWACGTSVDGTEDPHFLEDVDVRIRGDTKPELPPENWVTVARCSKPAKAHAMRVQLESDGIPVTIYNEFSTTTLFGLQSSAHAEVQVPAAYIQQAREILGIVEDEQQAGDEQQQDAEDESSRQEMDEQTDDASEEGIVDKNVVEGITKPPEQ